MDHFRPIRLVLPAGSCLLRPDSGLEAHTPLKYAGIWQAEKTHQENSLVTRDGSLWIAKRATASFPGGGAEPDAWQLCVKRGADGKDAK